MPLHTGAQMDAWLSVQHTGMPTAVTQIAMEFNSAYASAGRNIPIPCMDGYKVDGAASQRWMLMTCIADLMAHVNSA